MLFRSIDDDELHKMSNAQIADFITEYKEEKESGWKSFERVDLESSIRQYVSNNPERFSKELSAFFKVPRKYQHAILRGLEEAWRNDRDFDWTYLLEFILEVLGEETIWEEKAEKDAYDYNDGILRTIASLIHDGTKSDKHAFAVELLPLADRKSVV